MNLSITRKSVKSTYLLVWISYFFVCIQYFLSWHISGIDQVLRYGIAISLFLSIDYSNWDRFKIFLFLFLLVALVFRRLLVVWTLFALVYQIDYYQISLRDLARVALLIVCVELFIQIECVLIGLLENNAVKYIKSDAFTYDLGTGNANRCAGLFFRIVILSYIICRKFYKIFFCFLVSLMASLSYLITGSRTTLLCTLLILFLALMYWLYSYPRWIRYIIAFLPILLFGVTFYFALNFEENREINQVASGRLWYILKFTQEFTVKDWIIGAPRTIDDPLDSAYLEIIHTGGIALALFLCCAFLITTLNYYDRIKPYIPILIPVLLAGLTESILLRPSEISVVFWLLMLQSYIKQKPILT